MLSRVIGASTDRTLLGSTFSKRPETLCCRPLPARIASSKNETLDSLDDQRFPRSKHLQRNSPTTHILEAEVRELDASSTLRLPRVRKWRTPSMCWSGRVPELAEKQTTSSDPLCDHHAVQGGRRHRHDSAYQRIFAGCKDLSRRPYPINRGMKLGPTRGESRLRQHALSWAKAQAKSPRRLFLSDGWSQRLLTFPFDYGLKHINLAFKHALCKSTKSTCGMFGTVVEILIAG